MLLVPESQQIAERFAGEISDLRTLLHLHGLRSGRPECLIELPLRISQDHRLRSDLSEIVQTLQARNPEFDIADATSVFVLAATGSSMPARDRTLEEPMNLLGGFLSSLGGWPGPAMEPLLDLDNPPDHDPRLDPQFATATASAPSAAPRMVEEVEFSPDSESTQTAAPNLQGFANLAEINNALARLERGNLELRMHLDSIDQRICRMEPLLESTPHAGVPDAPERTITPVPTPNVPSLKAEPAPLAESLPSIAPLGRAAFSPETELSDDTLERDRNLRRLALTSAFSDPLPIEQPSVPTEITSSRPSSDPVLKPEGQVRHSRSLHPRKDRFAAAREIPGNSPDTDPLYTEVDPEPAPPAVATALPVRPVEEPAAPVLKTETIRAAEPVAPPPVELPALAETRERTPEVTRAIFDPEAAAPVEDHGTLFGTAETLAQESSEDEPSHKWSWIAGSVLAVVLGAAGFLYYNGVPPVLTHWLTGDATATSRPTAASDTDQAPATATEQSASTPPATSSSPRSSTRGVASSGISSTRGQGGSVLTSAPTFVPIMDGHLIAAPRPEYPQEASLAGVSGRVTLDVMISKSGSVEALKVLGGPHLLYDAATSAVRQWQYQPYLQKGKPVEVRTIVRLDVGPPSRAVER